MQLARSLAANSAAWLVVANFTNAETTISRLDTKNMYCEKGASQARWEEEDCVPPCACVRSFCNRGPHLVHDARKALNAGVFENLGQPETDFLTPARPRLGFFATLRRTVCPVDELVAIILKLRGIAMFGGCSLPLASLRGTYNGNNACTGRATRAHTYAHTHTRDHTHARAHARAHTLTLEWVMSYASRETFRSGCTMGCSFPA